MYVPRALIERTLAVIEPMSTNPFGVLRFLIRDLHKALEEPLDAQRIATEIVQNAIVADMGDEVKSIEFRCVEAIEAWLKEHP